MSPTESLDALLLRFCPNCDTDNSKERILAYSWQHWTLRRCKNCQFVYLENPPDYSSFESTHAWEKNSLDRDVRMRKEYPVARGASRLWRGLRRRLIRKPDKLAKRIARWVPPGRVIDVGCSSAERLLSLPAQYETLGIEVSRELARRAEANLATRNGTVIHAPAIEGLAKIEAATVTGVFMRSFLEHEHRPAALLEQVARVLKEDGIAIIKVPNFASVNRRVMGSRWCGFRFPGHVNYFAPASLKSMVEEVGLTTISLDYLIAFR